MKKIYAAALLCVVCTLTTTAQTRYWVGPASGTEAVWNNTTYWSTTSGGPGGASVPNGASFDVIFNQGASVNLDIASLTLNSLTVTNNATALIYTGINATMTLNSTDGGNPALNIDAGSTLRDSATAGIDFITVFAAGAKGEIDGDWRLATTPSFGNAPDAYFTATAAGVVVNVNSTGRVLFGNRGGGSAAPTTMFFNAGSYLVFDRNGGVTPTADFHANSIILVSGNTTQTVQFSGTPASVGSVEFNSPGYIPIGGAGNLQLNNTTIKGDLRILNTNNAKLVLFITLTGTDPIVSLIQGNLEVGSNSLVTLANPTAATTRTYTLTVNGNLTQTGGTISLQDFNGITSATTLSVKGNITQTAGTFTTNSTATNTGTNLFVLELSGAVNQNISVASGTIDNAANQVALRINNPAGATLTAPLAVGRMNFVNGVLNTTSANLLTINNRSSNAFVINGVSDNSFVSGPVKRRMNEAALYTFPTGKAGNYRKVEVTPSTTTASEFTAEYFNTAHPDADVVPPLTGRSNAEYWTVDRVTGSDASVTLTLEGAVPNASAFVDIYVGRYNGTAWQNVKGTTGTFVNGTATSGTVTSQVLSTFSPFTFVFGPQGALDIKITAFSATKGNGSNNIHWQAECSSTEAIFEVERSTDGQNFTRIERIVADQQRCLRPFDFADQSPAAGTNYYRLRVIDVDGTSFYSRIVAVINKSKGFELVGVYPSIITSGQLKVNITAANRDRAELWITNVNGQVLQRRIVSINSGENIVYMNVDGLAAGVYQVSSLNSDGEVKTVRFIKQ